jgi:hypothetical protein
MEDSKKGGSRGLGAGNRWAGDRASTIDEGVSRIKVCGWALGCNRCEEGEPFEVVN